MEPSLWYSVSGADLPLHMRGFMAPRGKTITLKAWLKTQTGSQKMERNNRLTFPLYDAATAGLRPCALWMICLASAVGSANAEESTGPLEVPSDFLGADFKPSEVPEELLNTEQGFFILRKLNVPSDQSDWERLGQIDFETDLKSVSIYGFQKITGTTLNERIQRAPLIRKFSSGLNDRYVFRPCVSDIGTTFGAYGGGTFLGILKFEFKDSPPLIVGVGQTSFFLGVWYGSKRQSFFSLPLSEAIHDYFRHRFGIKLDLKIKERLAGKQYQQLPNIFSEDRMGQQKAKPNRSNLNSTIEP